MAWMPGASRVQTFSGNGHREAVDILVVHTTEGSSWPGYNGGGYAPHVTLKHTGSIRQHIDTARSAKALVNRSGGVQTNNAGALQAECIGSCDRAYAQRHGLFYWPEATDDDLEPLARFMAWAHTEHGIPLTTRGLKFSGSNAYGVNAPQRMSFAEWRAFSGVCGHQHVPENDHWDPGAMPVARAVELARRLVNAGSIPSGGTSAPAPDPARPWRTSPRVSGFSETEVRRIQATLAGFDLDLGRYGIDGSYGDDTGRAVQQLQRELHITPTDGIYGPGTEQGVMTIREDIDYIKRIAIENQSRIGEIPGKVLDAPVILDGIDKGKKSNLRRKIQWQHNDYRATLAAIAGAQAAVIKAVQETGKAQGLTDAQLEKVATAAADAATRVSAEDVADQLEVTVSHTKG